MACECMQKTLDKTIEYKKQQNPNWTITEADYLNKTWNFSGKGNPNNLFNEIKIGYTFTKVDGSTSQPKSEKVAIFGEYCTFCGKKFKEDEAS